MRHSFYYAARGVSLGFAEERNFRVQCLYGALVLFLLLWLRPPLSQGALALFTVVVLLSAELANSALERLVDLVSPYHNPRAGEVKDLAAGAVMLVSFASALTVLMVLAGSLPSATLVGLAALLAIVLGGRR